MYGPVFHFAPIIPRGTPLPASRSEVFRTVSDRQERVEIDIYQGESDDVRRNHQVGMFHIEGLAPVPAGNQLVVQLDLTLDGILKVSAREKATGLQKHITIENALGRFSDEERHAASSRLEELWQQASTNNLPTHLRTTRTKGKNHRSSNRRAATWLRSCRCWMRVRGRPARGRPCPRVAGESRTTSREGDNGRSARSRSPHGKGSRGVKRSAMAHRSNRRR